MRKRRQGGEEGKEKGEIVQFEKFLGVRDW